MPYKDKKKRNELTRKHYERNKASYIKKAAKWKANNKEKVKESRIRYSEKKRIIGELNRIQKIYFKSFGKKKHKRFADLYINDDIHKLLRRIIRLQYHQIMGEYPKEDKEMDITLKFYEWGHIYILFSGYFLSIITEIEKGGEKYNISSRYFNSNLYNPLLHVLRNAAWFEDVFPERQKGSEYRFSNTQMGMDVLKFMNNPDKYTP